MVFFLGGKKGRWRFFFVRGEKGWVFGVEKRVVGFLGEKKESGFLGEKKGVGFWVQFSLLH